MTETATSGGLLQRLREIQIDRWLLVTVGLLLTLAVGLLSIFQPRPVRLGDLKIYDLMLAGRAQPPRTSVPILVGVDEDSLAAYGQWPWPRYRLAMLVDEVQRLGAEVVVLDFLMPEEDRTSPEVIAAERRRDLSQGAARLPRPDQDSNTQRLSSSLARGHTVLGYYLDFSRASTTAEPMHAPKLPPGMVVMRTGRPTTTQRVPLGQIRSLAALTQAAGAEGFTNAQKDPDGTLRRVPLLLSSGGVERPSLALSALMLASPSHTVRLLSDGNDTTLLWGPHRIPLDQAGNVVVDYRSQHFPYLSAHRILSAQVAAGSLQGKIVLIGAWATGLGDSHVRPSGQTIHGLEVHATLIDNILSDTFITRPPWAPGAELMAVLLAGGLCTWLLSRTGFSWSVLTLILGTAGTFWGARQLLITQGLHLSPLLPIVVMVLVTIVLSLLKYGVEARKLRQRTQDLLEAQDEIIISLSVLAEARDKETGGHIRRTQLYVDLLARQLATTPAYAHLSPSDIELLAKSAPLHDIGKVGIPDCILQKPGKLTPDEYTTMQSHTLIGAEALNKIVTGAGHPEKQAFLNYARQMTESHHERWDGRGYPHGLQGQAIPLAGRLMALADVYDAMISKRVYKKGMSHDEVRDYIALQSGTQFDPDIVAAFLARHEAFYDVAQRYADPQAFEQHQATPPALTA